MTSFFPNMLDNFPNIASKVRPMAEFFLRSILVFTLLGILLASCNHAPPKRIKSDAPSEEKVPKAENQDVEIWPKRGNIMTYFTKYGDENPERVVRLKTTLGDIDIELFEDTPLHRANFIHHVKRGLYDRTIFYRVIPDFMIQGGNSDDDKTVERRKGVESYYIPSEVKKHHIHERGSVAMAMSYHNNPENKSSQYDFYIVIGKTFNNNELDATKEEYHYNFDENDRKIYKTKGGTPHLDGKHTVFGRVIKGMEIVEEIARTDRDSGDWPINDVVIDYQIIE